MRGATWYYLEVQNASGGILLGKWYTARKHLCWSELCRDACGIEWSAEWPLQMAGAGLWQLRLWTLDGLTGIHPEPLVYENDEWHIAWCDVPLVGPL